MRPGTLTRIAIAALFIATPAVASCGAPPEGRSGAEPVTAEPGTASTTTAPTTATSSSNAVANTFRYELTGTFSDDEAKLTIELTGVVDLDADVAEMRIDARQYADLDSVDWQPGIDEIVIVQRPESQQVLGLWAPLVPDAIGEIDSAVWYDYDFFGDAGPDGFFLAGTLDATDLWALVDDLPAGEPDADRGAGFVRRSAVLSEAQLEPLWRSNTFFDFAGRSEDWIALTTAEDAQGRLISAQLDSEADGVATRITVEIVARGEAVEIASPTDVQPLILATPVTTTTTPDPGDVSLAEARERAMDDLRKRIVNPDRDPMDGVVIRVSIPGGWELPDEITQHLTVEADGRVVRVTDTSVISSTDDYTSLRLSPTGVDRLLELIGESAVLSMPRNLHDGGAGVSPTDRSVVLEVTDVGRASMDRIGSTDGYDEEQQAARADFDALLQQIIDLTWLGDDIVEPEGPWIPESMTVMAGDISPRSGLPDDAPFAPWPLSMTIEERATGTARNAYDEEELLICLNGDEVAPVFALLTGVNHAYLRVDDGQQWELNVMPHYPGYRLITDPCP